MTKSNQPSILQLNDPCPCCSGLTFGNCCQSKSSYFHIGSASIPVIQKQELPVSVQQVIQKDHERRDKFGEVRPLIHADWQGNKIIAVGNEVHWSKQWRYFTDFLQDYIKSVLTPEWGNSELAKPLAQRHPIIQWYGAMCRFQQVQAQQEDGTICCAPNGAMMAYLLVAYDLYVLRHHSSLQNAVVRRLKNPDQFQGARYELFVAATCIRARYRIDYEDESDHSQKHVEFVAVHTETQDEINVEAKSRHRKGILGQPGQQTRGQPRLTIGRLLNKALQKSTDKPLVVFIDVNVPPTMESPFEKPWFRQLLETLDRTIGTDTRKRDPFNLIVFTNHPFHYADDFEVAPKHETISVFGNNPVHSVSDQSIITSIHDAAMKYGTIPQFFEEAE